MSQFTGLYYTFDGQNQYVRSPGFTISYIAPVLIIILQHSVVLRYRRLLRRTITISLYLNTLVPLLASIVQLFAYGISFINMSIDGVVIALYIFALVDMNDALLEARKKEREAYEKDKQNQRALFEQTAEALVLAIEAKDKYTHGHSSRVARYSTMIAREAGKSEEEIRLLYYVALPHDVGKIGIPDQIINKVGKLTDEEFAQIKQHPVLGNNILSRIRNMPYLSIGAHYHHERYDGRGYPEGLKGEDIPEIARIIAVADAYDAMTSKRSSRFAYSSIVGENCEMSPIHITVESDDAPEGYIPRIAEEISFIQGCPQGDVPNVQIDSWRSESTEGIPLAGDMRLTFHAKSLPTARLVWHCPFISLFSSKDGRPGGQGYREFLLVRLDGENWDSDDHAENDVRVDHTRAFEGWNAWKEKNRQGIDCEVNIQRDGKHVSISSETLGIAIHTETTVMDDVDELYVALTGDQCAITNIRVQKA